LATMKKSFFLFAFFFVALFAQAQKVYFIYIQSDTGTPFFVKMDQKVQSSSVAGYIILSGLRDSTYNFAIGFPGKQQENKFSVTIDKMDRGFLLRTADNQPTLFDLQTLILYKATAGIKEPEYNLPELMAQADAFTKLLSLATDDPSILLSGPSQPKSQTLAASNEQGVDSTRSIAIITKTQIDSVEVSAPVAIAEKKQEDSVSVTAIQIANPVSVSDISETKQASLPKDTIANTNAVSAEPVQQVELKANADVKTNDETIPATDQAYQKTVVTRRSESSTTEGFGLVFLDNSGDRTDTIRLLIPNPKMVARIQQPVKQEEIEKSLVQVEEKVEKPEETVVLTKTCAEIASDKDFLKLRKSMAAEETDAGMIKAAVKYFNKKCFSTEQVKNLSALFLTPAGKFDFFNAAYGYTSDKEVFASLQSELKDEYYAGRFRDLLGGR
jgi:hypothetical protein